MEFPGFPSEDYATWCSLALQGRLEYLPRVITCRRRHSGQVTSSNGIRLARGSLEVARYYFAQALATGKVSADDWAEVSRRHRLTIARACWASVQSERGGPRMGERPFQSLRTISEWWDGTQDRGSCCHRVLAHAHRYGLARSIHCCIPRLAPKSVATSQSLWRSTENVPRGQYENAIHRRGPHGRLQILPASHPPSLDSRPCCPGGDGCAEPGRRCESQSEVNIYTAYLLALSKLSGASLKDLSRGGTGSGLILYYRRGQPMRRPSIVVSLEKAQDASTATAKVFDAAPGGRFVPVLVRHHVVSLKPSLKPVLVIQSLSGWWKRGTRVSDDLRIRVFGRIEAMWDGPPERALPKDGLSATIETRMFPDGQPEWDYRRLAGSYPQAGYVRANYAQSECPDRARRLASITSEWPFLSPESASTLRKKHRKHPSGPVAGEDFLQPIGALKPPIVVNWKQGRVVTLSEIVTVRDQPCSYDLYSLSPLASGRINHPDFESPWGFYNLTNRRERYPNLIIRTEHYAAEDPWVVGIAGTNFRHAPLLGSPNEDVRYSWADHPGNQDFSYKLDVFGFHGYPKVVPIAGGVVNIDAPSYGGYPSWVISHSWPSVTFVDANPDSYNTSEGIYDWPARDIGGEYWRGWKDSPNLGQFASIKVGLRGEYRVGESFPTMLYASPIDMKLHLLHAQAGVWSFSHRWMLVERNLDKGRYIDEWLLERRPANRKFRGKTHLKSWLANLDGYLLYSGQGEAAIKRETAAEQNMWIRPPTSKVSWRSFVRQARPYDRGRNPGDLVSWFQAFHGPVALFPGGSIHDIKALSKGFRFRLDVPKLARHSGRQFGLRISKPGDYTVGYSKVGRKWSVTARLVDLTGRSDPLASRQLATTPTVAAPSTLRRLQLSLDDGWKAAPVVVLLAGALTLATLGTWKLR